MINETKIDKIRTRVRATYLEAKSKKGFKGNWEMKYVLHDVICIENNTLVCGTTMLNDVGCIKGKNFKNGDLLEFDVTISVDSKGKYKISRPSNLECVGNIHD